MPIKTIKNKTVHIQSRDQSDVLIGTSRALDASTSLTPTDQDIEIVTDSAGSGSRAHIADGMQIDGTIEVPIAGSGQVSVEPPFTEVHKACAQKLDSIKIITVNNISGTGFSIGETLQNTTTPADIGRVITNIPLNKIDGALAVDGINALGSANVNVILTANAAWDSNVYARLLEGTTIEIAGTKYELTATVDWSETESAAVLPITPALDAATVGSEPITIFDLRLISIFALDTAPIVSDEVIGVTSSTTGTTFGIEDAFLYHESLSDQYSVDIETNVDGYFTVTQRARGTGEFTYAKGSNGVASYTINGSYIKPTDSVLIPDLPACLSITPCRDARLIFNEYDVRKHQVDSVSFNLNVTVTADASQTGQFTIRGFRATDIMPTAAFTIGKLDVADFDVHALRDSYGSNFVITYEHNPYGTEQTRLIHVIPRGQFSSRPGTGDMDGTLSDELEVSCTIPCGVLAGLPKHALIVY